jgi:iron complex outermembrane receptor protein
MPCSALAGRMPPRRSRPRHPSLDAPSRSPASAPRWRARSTPSARTSGIVDVIKAEDIAKFPDTNLAESLQRVPGVVIDRDAGEGRNITVRGLGADFTRVRINGIEALATTGGTDSSGGANRSRGFDFNVFASELFNSPHGAQEQRRPTSTKARWAPRSTCRLARPFDFKGFTATVSAKGQATTT